MKKTSLLLGALLLQLTASYAQQQIPSRNIHRARTLLASRLNDVLKVNTLRARDGEETPLAQGRRIIKQEMLHSEMLLGPELEITYGYTSPDKGQEFHPSMIYGFPIDIRVAGKTDQVLFHNELYSNPGQYSFPNHQLGVELVFDTLNVHYKNGDLKRSVIAERSANNLANKITRTEEGFGGLDIVKYEKFYTNNLLTRVDEYYGASLGALELGSRRVITYDNAQKVTADTIFVYDMGAVVDTMLFDYNYNTNGDVSEITMSYGDGYSAHIAVAYYADNRYKSYLMTHTLPGSPVSAQSDSVGYAANGFMSVQKVGFGGDNGAGGLEFNYDVVTLVYNGNLLDTVRRTTINKQGDVYEGPFSKYHYSLDNNPDSMLVYYEAGSTAEERMIFHYEPYTPTSVKQITRNNNFNIYPNPIGATMNIYNKVTLKDRKATIMITDIKGSRIWSVEQALTQGANQVNIPAGLSAGTYVISITADNSVYTQKVIKQ